MQSVSNDNLYQSESLNTDHKIFINTILKENNNEFITLRQKILNTKVAGELKTEASENNHKSDKKKLNFPKPDKPDKFKAKLNDLIVEADKESNFYH